MTPKLTVILAVVCAAIGWAGARFYYGQSETKTVTKETEHTVTHTIIVERPDGSKTTDTIIDSKETKKTDSVVKVQTSKKGLNVSVLASNDFSSRLLKPVYGASVSKELIGPITVGVFGFTNGVLGVSVGLNF